METPINIEAQLATSTDNALHLDHPWPPQPTPHPSPLRKMFLISSIAVGIQFGWGIPLSHLASYYQLLNISHPSNEFIGLCGPISAIILQPTLGYYSDQCTSRFGRRRPFIVAGTGLMVLAEFLIGYAADIGHLSNDPSHTVCNHGYFLGGFSILVAGCNMLVLACRVLLADMAAEDQAKTHIANASFSFFLAFGNILGYAAGNYRNIYLVFPFTRTATCDINCADLKSRLIISIALQICLTSLALSFVTEKTYLPSVEVQGRAQVKRAWIPFLFALKGLSRPMWILMLVMCLTYIACFSFLWFGMMNWMGSDIYGGRVGDHRYDLGMQVVGLGMMFHSVVSGVMSLAIEPLRRLVGGAKRLWGIVNLVMAICLPMIVLVTKTAQHVRHQAALGGAAEVPMPSDVVKACALALFSLSGIPLAVIHSTPYALASIFSVSAGAGQGLSIGVLEVAIAIPQIFVPLTSGPWNALFGGGNLPTIVVGAIMATASSILMFTLLPEPN